ncbi:MAG: RidA family protein [Gammaproteobacteria bacterium]|nr:RidA family protein [Gammaproteobacteria bacterium]
MPRSIISTDKAPSAIGAYSQAVRAGDHLYVSGQIPLDPASGDMVPGDVKAQTVRVFENLKAVAEAGGYSLNDAVKLTVYLTDLSAFATINDVMATFFAEPFPARAAVEVSALPKGSLVEVDAILWKDGS